MRSSTQGVWNAVAEKKSNESWLAIDRGLPVGRKAALGPDAKGPFGDELICRFEQGKIIREMADTKVLVFDGHRRPHMHLHGQNPFQRTPFRVQVNQVGGRMPIDPMPVMITLHEHSIFMPLTRLKGFNWHVTDNP